MSRVIAGAGGAVGFVLAISAAGTASGTRAAPPADGFIKLNGPQIGAAASKAKP